MYFWRIEELKSKLRAAPLSERELLPYFLIFLLASEFASLIPSPPTTNFWDYANVLYGATLTFLGTLYVYRLNSGNDGNYFLQRYLALGWVITIRVLAVASPIYLVFCIFFGCPEESNGFAFSYLALVELILYQRMGKHIRDINVIDDQGKS